MSYWHRGHRVGLVASDLKATGVSRFHWILPGPSQFPVFNDALPPSISFAFAEMVIGLVSRRALVLSPATLRETYRQGLRNMGLLGATGRRLMHDEAGRRYASFVSPLVPISQLDGLPSTERSAAAEIARLIGPVRSGIHPLRHLSLATWLFESTNAFLEQYEATQRKRGVFEAEDDAFEQTSTAIENDGRKSNFLALLRAGASVSRAAREIGIDTTTGIVWAAVQGIATPRRPKLLKRGVRDVLMRLLRRGISKARAAAVGKVSVQTITTLLRSEVGLHEAWRQAQFANARRRSRRRWLRCITANPHSGVKAARLAAPSAYAWLYRNDRDWLAEQTNAMHKAIRNPLARVDWDSRDRQVSDMVRQVALRLHEEAPGRPLKLFLIYQQLPELKAKLFKLDRLPLTRTALLEVLGK